MKKMLLGIWLMAGMVTFSSAATRGDVKVLEAADTIRSVSDNLAQAYLLYTLFPQKKGLKEKMKSELEALPKGFQDIAVATRDERTRGLLSFFAYQKARADAIVQAPRPSRELADEMLEMSQSFVEGAESIARHHAYNFSQEEQMFMLTRTMQRDLASLAKYYTAWQLFPDDPSLSQKIKKILEQFEGALKRLNTYPYKDPKMEQVRTTLNALWKTVRPYWEQKTPQGGLPLVLSLATDRMTDLLGTLGVYHSKNQ